MESERTIKLIGDENFAVLQKARVAIAGLGGVGSYAAEAIARSGIGYITIIDCDAVAESNLNRQLYALRSTVGKDKCEVAARRIRDINPDIIINTKNIRITADNVAEAIGDMDAVIDAVDDIGAKLAIVQYCAEKGIGLISCMGTGNKTQPDRLRVADIYETKVCPLARKMRYELKKRQVDRLCVVYSEEAPLVKEHPPASMVFVPACAGIFAAREVVFRLIEGWDSEE